MKQADRHNESATTKNLCTSPPYRLIPPNTRKGDVPLFGKGKRGRSPFREPLKRGTSPFSLFLFLGHLARTRVGLKHVAEIDAAVDTDGGAAFDADERWEDARAAKPAPKLTVRLVPVLKKATSSGA